MKSLSYNYEYMYLILQGNILRFNKKSGIARARNVCVCVYVCDLVSVNLMKSEIVIIIKRNFSNIIHSVCNSIESKLTKSWKKIKFYYSFIILKFLRKCFI